jgi:molybdopterin-guanine dinucleotide biosynthesis protein A
MDYTCAILAGGKSTRMGADKATLKVHDKALIQQVYEKAHHVFKDILIISNHHDRFYGIDSPIIKDIFPVQSSIVGITSALLSSNTSYVFILACDMPFVSVQSIECVLNNVHGEDIVIPHTKNGFEPLHAVYNRSCISVLLTSIGRHQLKVTDLFPFFSVKEIGEDPAFVNRGTSVFTNITVKEDLSLVQRLGNG